MRRQTIWIFLKRKENLIAVFACVVLVSYIGFLLGANYLSQKELQVSALLQFRMETKKLATEAGYFYEDRKRDLTSLAKSNTLSDFFENKALGMSMKYGLGASLLNISDQFNHFVEEKKLGGQQIYSRVVFLNGDGGVLVDTAKGSPMPESLVDLIETAVSGNQAPIIIDQHDRLSLQVVVAIPYYFKNNHAGQIIAWITPQIVHKSFTKTNGSAAQMTGILCQKNSLHTAGDIFQNLPLFKQKTFKEAASDQPHRFEMPDSKGTTTEMVASQVPIEGTPFAVLNILPVAEVFGFTAPNHLLITMATLALIILGGTGFVLRINTRNLVLNKEIIERKKAESGLREARNKLEIRVMERTEELARKNDQLNFELTERRRAEVEQARLVTAIEQAAETIVITDTQSTIQYVNPAFEHITGYTREEAIGNPIRILKSGKHDNVFYKTMWDTLVRGDIWKGRIINKKKDGNLYEEEATISPVRDSSGTIINYVAVKRDVTKEVLLERQLRQSQKLESLGTLAGGIAHEINTPIQYVGDNTRFLQEAFNDLDELLVTYNSLLEAIKTEKLTTDHLREIESLSKEIDLEYLKQEIPSAIEQNLTGLESVTRIIRSMKDFSHPGTADKSPVDINLAIENTIAVAQNEWKYVAEVKTEFATNLPLIPCFQGELNQVVLNMIINAAHAISGAEREGSNERGTITISTLCNDDWAEIRITDTGTGIPEEIRARIFDPFFTTKEVGKGTGQGLAISHAVIVEKHGGTLDFETQMGTGTSFIIRLPMKTDA